VSVHCGTKVRHPTREAALDHIKRLAWLNHTSGQSERSAGLAAYPCDRCGAWHVGHQQTAPPCYHYTVGANLAAILKADALRPARPRRATFRRTGSAVVATMAEPVPLLWFSRNPVWEYSVMKVITRDQSLAYIGRAMTEVAGEGLLRFAVPSSLATLRWSDYLRLNPTPTRVRDDMAKIGNPIEWLATDQSVSLGDVRAIEVYYQGAWVSVNDVTDEAFDAYLAERPTVYATAAESLYAKHLAAQQQPEAVIRDMIDRLTEAERILFDDRTAQSMVGVNAYPTIVSDEEEWSGVQS
jgi:hypothetical protein